MTSRRQKTGVRSQKSEEEQILRFHGKPGQVAQDDNPTRDREGAGKKKSDPPALKLRRARVRRQEKSGFLDSLRSLGMKARSWESE